MEEIKKDLEETVEAAEEKAEEIVEAAEEKAEEAVEAVEEKAEEVVEAVEEKAEESAEAAEKLAEEAEQAAVEAEEKAEEAIEKAEEAVEKAKEVKAPKKKDVPIIKKKKKMNSTVLILIIVLVVVVLASAGFVIYEKTDWLSFLKPKVTEKMEMADYSTIEVKKSAVEVTEETVNSYIDSLLQSQTKEEQETEGVVAEGDLLTIDYKGKLTTTGEEFAGGTAENQSCTVGAGQYISGFEEGLVGQKIGSTVTVNVIFPSDYSNADLAGKPASFEITIKYRTKSVTPELNDEFVEHYSYNYLPVQLHTVDELKAYTKDYIYHYYLHEAMMQDLQKKQVVVTYDPEKEANLVTYAKRSLEYSAAMYGYDADTFAMMYGYSSAEDYALDEAHYYLDIIMLVDKIFKDKDLTYTEEELDQAIVEYMARGGYNETYTLEEFKEQSGEEWIYLFTNLDFKYDKALEALEGNVVFVDKLSDEEDETESETESVTEAETESATETETESATEGTTEGTTEATTEAATETETTSAAE